MNAFHFKSHRAEVANWQVGGRIKSLVCSVEPELKKNFFNLVANTLENQNFSYKNPDSQLLLKNERIRRHYMASTGWGSCSPMGGTGRLQFATVPTMLYGLSDTEKAGHCHYHHALLISPPGLLHRHLLKAQQQLSKSSRLHRRCETEKVNNLHTVSVHLAPIKTQRLLPLPSEPN